MKRSGAAQNSEKIKRESGLTAEGIKAANSGIDYSAEKFMKRSGANLTPKF